MFLKWFILSMLNAFQVEFVADDEVDDLSDMEDMEDLSSEEEDEKETESQVSKKRKHLSIEYEHEPSTSGTKREKVTF